MSEITVERIEIARDWIADAYPESPFDMSDEHPVYGMNGWAVQLMTNRRYPGGWAAFVEECCTFVQL
jgi:hypothetical protein